MNLDHDACYRAVASRDARFDGRIFTGVKTTGIYCRPICPARTPKSSNVVFFSTAAAAQEAGFRSCLRCRPECSPDLAIWRGTSNTVSRGLALIADGALDGDEANVEQLAERLGMGERQLRRLFQQHIGASPVTVAQTRRVLFAKQLIAETAMPLAEVALASGFGSVRRFNAVFQKLYRRPPGEFRRAKDAPGSALVLTLPFAPPYEFKAMLGALAARADGAVERVESGSWHRRVTIDGASGTVDVRPADNVVNALQATIRFPDVAVLPVIVRRIRRVFDLSADPIMIGKQLADDRVLAPLVRKRPGLRVPGPWDDAPEAADEAPYDVFDITPRLRNAFARLSGQRAIAASDLERRAARWRPWRAYAAAHLLAADSGALLAAPRAPGPQRATRRLARAS
jgi:AraC family transcriptional regulator, regulatory protein of adaptative response / DNA-3-methyladenine glycosylase II